MLFRPIRTADPHGDPAATRPATHPPLAAVLGATLLGTATVFGAATPATAAPVKPVITGPAMAKGYSAVEVTGTAAPNAEVKLREAAWMFWHLNGAVEIQDAQRWGPPHEYPVTANPVTKADSSGRFSITRVVDSGFVFTVVADELESDVFEVGMELNPIVASVVSNGPGNVTATADVGLSQGYLRVNLEHRDGTTWRTVGTGYTDASGHVVVTAADQPSGAQAYRLLFEGDDANLLTGTYSVHDYTVDVGGTTATRQTTGVGRPAITPAPKDNPAPTPDKPAPTPDEPAPDKPAPDQPAPDKPTPDKPTPDKPAPDQPAPDKPAPDKPAPDKPAPAPGKPAPGKPAPPAEPAVGSVQFTKIVYDARGRDTRSNRSLNAEWVRLTNKSRSAINLKGWTVRDAAGHIYRFAASYRLGVGANVYVRTGKGVDNRPVRHRYWGRSSHVWNNSGDDAYLGTPAGKVIDSCHFKNKRSGITYCG